MAKPTKDEIRRSSLKKRDALEPNVRVRDSALIRHRLFQHPAWMDSTTILTYVSFRSEVDTHKIIQEALDLRKRVVVPIVNKEHKELSLSELHALGDLGAGPFQGVYEPTAAHRHLVDPQEVELVIVPGIIFDRLGGRLGFGGGFFDRLLSRMPNAQRVALAFSSQVHKTSLPLEPHDMRMHAIITEKEVIRI